jgi:medium-chain acyl-[acyl-carrier-protein] hydrolase
LKATEESAWTSSRVPNPDARIRLICYPHAGGGASAFMPWRRILPPEIELCPVEPPGRGSRHREPLLRRVTDAAESLAEGLRPLLDKPYLLVGHSLGGFVAFETARRLQAKGQRSPEQLVVVSRAAPHLPIERIFAPGMSDEALIGRLGERYGGARLKALEDPEIREMFMAVVRADLESLETYEHVHQPLLDCPIAAFGGDADPTISSSALRGWRAQTRASFQWQAFSGDHFLLHDPGGPLRDRVISLALSALEAQPV